MKAREQPGAWLCPTELDRQRVLDMSPRVRRARTIGSAAVGVATLLLAPLLSWWLVGLFFLSALNLATLDRRMARSPRPERVVAGSLLWTELLIAGAAALSGGPRSPLLFWLAIPVGMASARFRGAVVTVATGIGALFVLGVSLVDPAGLADDPTLAIAALILLINVAAITAALGGAEVQHRSDAVLDPLTGLLNRKALQARFAELAAQARVQDAPVCVIACDLDGFKRVNDEHGHERGDTVLRDVAHEMRRSLRSFELMYRLGGEEFLVVLPGSDLPSGAAVAERLRAAVESARPGGLDVTLSAGVAAARGEAVDYGALFAAADSALYEAKDAGRNRVACAGAEAPTVLWRPRTSDSALV